MGTATRDLLGAITAPVILLEGTRQLPVEERAPLEKLARTLFREFPQAIFRSGNAEGTDTVFAKAIADLDPARLQLVLPNSGMGRARRPAGAVCFSLEELPKDELETLAAIAAQISRDAGRLAGFHLSDPAVRKTAAGSKAAYLLRDTIKVVGSASLGLSPASFGYFRVNPTDPHGGGTGYTIKVCALRGVPRANALDYLPLD